MAGPARRQSLTYDQYLALEEETGLRHEFLDGEAWPMAGGSLRDSAIKTNLARTVGLALRGQPCRAYDSDAKHIVSATGLATYPDLSIICGEPQRAEQDRHAATNPVALFEVLSPGTEGWDRGGKFRHYRHVDRLQHYVLVSTEAERVELFTRGEGGSWVLREFGAGTRFELPGVGITLAVDDFYVDLPAEDAEGESTGEGSGPSTT